MNNPQLSISVSDLIDVPKVTLRGSLECWHDQALLGVLTAFRDQQAPSLVLDLARFSFACADSAASMTSVLRSLGPQMCVHVIASGKTAAILRRARLGHSVRLYSSTNEVAERLPTEDQFLTSGWLASEPVDVEMPFAA
jgi:hypothetical protein